MPTRKTKYPYPGNSRVRGELASNSTPTNEQIWIIFETEMTKLKEVENVLETSDFHFSFEE